MLDDAIACAFNRFEDFLSVQGRKPPVGALHNLQAAVGIDDDERTVIRERARALGLEDAAGALALGVVLGLLAAGDLE
jgi:hypothetical protein